MSPPALLVWSQRGREMAPEHVLTLVPMEDLSDRIAAIETKLAQVKEYL